MTTKENLPNQKNSDTSASEAVEAVVVFCRDLVAGMNLDLAVTGREEGSAIIINLSGSDRPYLLSGSAAVLNAVEYLVNRIFRGGREWKMESIIIDSDSYRKHREAELELLAKMASEKVLASGRPLNLHPMNPRERRIVHLALAGIEGIQSRSDGEGEERSVTIYPENKGGNTEGPPPGRKPGRIR